MSKGNLGQRKIDRDSGVCVTCLCVTCFCVCVRACMRACVCLSVKTAISFCNLCLWRGANGLSASCAIFINLHNLLCQAMIKIKVVVFLCFFFFAATKNTSGCCNRQQQQPHGALKLLWVYVIMSVTLQRVRPAWGDAYLKTITLCQNLGNQSS